MVIAVVGVARRLTCIGRYAIGNGRGDIKNVIGMGSAHGAVVAAEEEHSVILGREISVRGPHRRAYIAVPAIDRDQVPNPLPIVLNAVVQFGWQSSRPTVACRLVHFPDDRTVKAHLPAHSGNDEVDGHDKLIIGKGHARKVAPAVVVQGIAGKRVHVPAVGRIARLAEADHNFAGARGIAHKEEQDPAVFGVVVEQARVARVSRGLNTRSLGQGQKLLRKVKGVCLEVPGPNARIHRSQEDTVLGESHRVIVGRAACQGIGHPVDGIDQLHPEFIQ